MGEQSQQNLEALAEEDPVSRPLASLQLEALRAASDPDWDRAAPSLNEVPFGSNVPALHGQRIPIKRRKVARLVNDLSKTLAGSDDIGPELAPRRIPEVTAVNLLEASIEGDAQAITWIASELDAEPAVIATVGQHAALPVLLACGRQLRSDGLRASWEPGYCPVCASWPALAEFRGLDRQQWLRCNRCASAWRSRHQRCVYCGNTDHQTLGYMAPEAERESRRAITCDACKGYLKAFATVTPPDISDILRMDLQSLELDIAATDNGYARPEWPGFAIAVELAPAQDGMRRLWPWS